jgi:hypothetical protein
MICMASIVVLRHVFTRRPSFPQATVYLEIESGCVSHTFCAEEARRAKEKAIYSAVQVDSFVVINCVGKFIEIFTGRPIETAS